MRSARSHLPSSCLLAYARAHRPRFVMELQGLIRFPTISSLPQHASDLTRCAAWLAKHMRQIGLDEVKVIPTARHPVVYAEWLRAPGRPTVLIYGHYDVQPVDPLNEWETPPFEPTIRGDNLHGRGASDDKGQLWAQLKALETYLRTERALPVNVKCLIEGEEEIGSPNLLPVIAQNKRTLAADVAVMSDTAILAPDRPAITYALRGGLGFELLVRGPRQDLHSGTFGGAVHNPLQALCEIVADLHDVNGLVTIPGYYDSVRQWSREEREYMAQVGPTDTEVLRNAQADEGWGESGYSLYERQTIRPALTINGITGGYQGPDSKAVIPARAEAKLSFRLVPDQDPREIERLFRRHIARIAPSTVQVSIHTNMRASPSLIDRDHPAMHAAVAAYRRGFGVAPVFLRSGGTIPVVNIFQQLLNIPTILMGFGLPDDRIHAPNERFYLPNFFNGITTCIWFLQQVGAGSGQRLQAERRSGST
jgi:acetylornithine deacetylase/succinyl-diaminopimelate desuccinylase-like protein